MNDPIAIAGYGACTPFGSSWQETRSKLLNGSVAPSIETVHEQVTCLGRVATHCEESHPRYHELANQAIDDLKDGVTIQSGASLGVVASTSKGETGNGKPDSITGLGNPGVWCARLAERFGSQTTVSSPNTACATGLTATIQGARMIDDGDVHQAMIVATESCFIPLLLAGYRSLGVLCDRQGMRPFHPDRSGFALSEGAGSMYLVDPEFAKDNNLEVLGYITGWGESCDALHMTKMDAEGRQLDRAIQLSLERSGITRQDVDLVHAHLTTTEANDHTEKQLLSDWGGRPILQGIKPALGHSIGAAGLLELIASVDTLNSGDAFPLPTTRREDLPNKSLAPNNYDSDSAEWGVTWNMGFGGHNAAVTIRKTAQN